MKALFAEDRQLQSFLNSHCVIWNFNTPYSFHMGGSWERLIGVSRRILDNILYDTKRHKFTHEVLTTFLAETMAIMNSRSLVPISSDHKSPCVLSPNALLTQKTNSQTDDFSYLDTKDVYTKQWKFVQVMADRFWTQWRQEYLQTLQSRRKWEKLI